MASRPLLVAAGLVALAGPAHGWRVLTRGSAGALGVADGDVVAAGSIPRLYDAPVVKVLCLTPARRVRWRFSGNFGVPHAVAFDGAGDVVFAGERLEGRISNASFNVVKLDGRKGTERWHAVLDDGVATAVAVAPGGDAIAAGRNAGAFAVARLAGATGAVVWRESFAAPTAATRPNGAAALALDAAGDAIAAGNLGGDLLVVKLAGVDGAERWRAVVPGAAGRTLALADGGDVLVGGTDGDLLVVRLAGADGAERWRARLPDGRASALMSGGSDVLVAARLAGRFAVVALDASTGAERWRMTSGSGDADEARSVALDARGDVQAAGTATYGDGNRSFVLVALDRATGELARLRRVDGSARAADVDEGVAVATDARGGVFAVGSIGRGRLGVGREQRLVVLGLPGNPRRGSTAARNPVRPARR